jgi:hypothetical protein
MPIWEVSEPYINLWLFDEPLRYQPALGDRVSFKLTYKQRSEDEDRPNISDFSNVGPSWYCPWLSTVHLGYTGQVAFNYGRGGEALFTQSEL